MRLTKFDHSAVMLELNDRNILVDPGYFTELPEDLPMIDILVVTEEHRDHFYLENIEKILQTNPSLEIFSTAKVCTELKQHDIKATTITGEQNITCLGINLGFKETDHAIVYRVSPCRVITVQVEKLFYYASDSFVPPPEKCTVVAIPTSGPWLKTSDSIDYANTVLADYLMAIHNVFHTKAGNEMANRLISGNLKNPKARLLTPNSGETIDL